MKHITIHDKTIGENEPCFIIGEVASAHEGSLETLKQMAEAAYNTGVDAIKFQIFRTDELLTPYHPKYEIFKKIELKENEWIELFDYIKDFNIIVLVDIFDFESLKLIDNLEIHGIKIHATDLNNPYMLKNVALMKKPIFLSIAGSTIEEIENAIDVIKSTGNTDIILMHGFQNYPTKLMDTNLNFIDTLKNLFNLPVGFSDHTDGGSDLSLIIPLLARAKGVAVIEKHFTLNRKSRGIDFESSINPDDLKYLVKKMGETEESFGSPVKQMSNDEIEYLIDVRKSIVASKDMKKSDIVTKKSMKFKRTHMTGLKPSECDKLLGKKLIRDLKYNDVITLKDIN